MSPKAAQNLEAGELLVKFHPESVVQPDGNTVIDYGQVIRQAASGKGVSVTWERTALNEVMPFEAFRDVEVEPAGYDFDVRELED